MIYALYTTTVTCSLTYLPTTTSPPMALHALISSILFFFNDTATTEIYTLSLHDALPICRDLELLRSIGCDCVQGYLLPAAVPASEFALMLASEPRHQGNPT